MHALLHNNNTYINTHMYRYIYNGKHEHTKWSCIKHVCTQLEVSARTNTDTKMYIHTHRHLRICTHASSLQLRVSTLCKPIVVNAIFFDYGALISLLVNKQGSYSVCKNANMVPRGIGFRHRPPHAVPALSLKCLRGGRLASWRAGALHRVHRIPTKDPQQCTRV